MTSNSRHLRPSRLAGGQATFMVKTRQATPAVPTVAAVWFGWGAVSVAHHAVTRAAGDDVPFMRRGENAYEAE